MEIIGKNLLSTMRRIQRLLQSNDQADQISASQNKVVNIKFYQVLLNIYCSIVNVNRSRWSISNIHLKKDDRNVGENSAQNNIFMERL